MLTVLWDAGRPLTPRDVHQSLSDLAYTTVLTTLTRLHTKGFVSRVPELRSYAYQPVENSAAYAARRIHDLLQAADSEQVLVRFVDELSPAEEQLLLRLLAENSTR